MAFLSVNAASRGEQRLAAQIRRIQEMIDTGRKRLDPLQARCLAHQLIVDRNSERDEHLGLRNIECDLADFPRQKQMQLWKALAQRSSIDLSEVVQDEDGARV
jgi:imidazoleglycerol phosphate synthase glutamine amidotransferase subunit HisH